MDTTESHTNQYSDEVINIVSRSARDRKTLLPVSYAEVDISQVQMRKKRTGILAWWRGYRRERRSSAKRYSALSKKQTLRCRICTLLFVVLVLIIGLAVMSYFIYQLHRDNLKLEKEVLLLGKERDCFKTEVSTMILSVGR